MKTLRKWLGRFVLLCIFFIAGVAMFGPREEVDLDVVFDADVIGSDVQAYFDQREAVFDDIVEGTNKRVIWAGEANTKAAVTVLYIHGFSATSEEIRPVPDKLADALGANLVFTRLRGHGRSEDAMGEPTSADWMRDTLEALAVARAVGDRVIVVSTSTGGTLLAAASLREDAMENVAGVVFVSPNFALNSRFAGILTWPAVRYWGPIIAGSRRSFTVQNDNHEKYWTNRYPTVALMPMAALVKAVDALDLGRAKVPALFVISNQDRVVNPRKTREVMQEWGGASELMVLTLNAGDDSNNHLIAGDFLSPSQTDLAANAMIGWAKRFLAQ